MQYTTLFWCSVLTTPSSQHQFKDLVAKSDLPNHAPKLHYQIIRLLKFSNFDVFDHLKYFPDVTVIWLQRI